jgi:uncharacterized protein with GYD domain
VSVDGTYPRRFVLTGALRVGTSRCGGTMGLRNATLLRCARGWLICPRPGDTSRSPFRGDRIPAKIAVDGNTRGIIVLNPAGSRRRPCGDGLLAKGGLQRVRESPSRLDAARKAYQVAGVKMKDFYMVTGQYDFVVISEAPDDGVMARVNPSLASASNVQTETLRAFTKEEYRIIMGAV